MIKGIVLRSTGSWYDVRTEEGKHMSCRLKGKMRLLDSHATNPVAVGDKVIVEFNGSEDSYVISEVEERNNYIVRESPKHKMAKHIVAANVDQAFLIVTISSPRTSTGFIDRFLVTAEAYHIPCHIIFNKVDIYKDKDLAKLEEYTSIYKEIGYPVHIISAHNKKDIDALKELLKDKVTLFSGHSGVGKSTLINAFHPTLSLKTGEISGKHDKGMHTTTFAEMHELPNGGYIIDTPGIKEFGLLDFEPEEICHYFIEMKEYAEKCQFNNCTHYDEPKCAVKKAVDEGKIHIERYKNYLNILEDYKANYKHWERR